MMSSKIYAYLAKLIDANGRPLLDGQSLFGYKFHILDELDSSANTAAGAAHGLAVGAEQAPIAAVRDGAYGPGDADAARKSSILFGNFEQGHLIADMRSAEVSVTNDYATPGHLGIIYSGNCGAGVINKEALSVLQVKLPA